MMLTGQVWAILRLGMEIKLSRIEIKRHEANENMLYQITVDQIDVK